MRIFVVNPNTSKSMTDHLRRELEKIKRTDTELKVVCSEYGPITIESAYDEALAEPATLERVRQANEEGYDAVILACFSDPALDAAKEISEIPVVGIEESTMHIAAMLGHKFSITTSGKNRVPTRDLHVRKHGLESRFASTLVLDMSVAEMDANPDRAKARILEVALSLPQLPLQTLESVGRGHGPLAGELLRELVDPRPQRLHLGSALVGPLVELLELALALLHAADRTLRIEEADVARVGGQGRRHHQTTEDPRCVNSHGTSRSHCRPTLPQPAQRSIAECSTLGWTPPRDALH